TPHEAFAVLQKTSLVLSEDSGLMHMAWTSGIPTMVLFGSTSSYWSRPLGDHSHFLDSSDLACGNCMQAVCSFGDVHCLTRYTPEFVLQQALPLVQKKISRQPKAVGQVIISDQSHKI
ncbi:MAG TPA: glycosyltransferase family 9 protein, partial [Puia sp.]|nr:glycosyltransferase family 9 protein [Puia sp.]